MYWHLFLDEYLYSVSLYDSQKTLKVRCRYIVIAQYNNKLMAYGLNTLTTPSESSAAVEEHLHWSWY